MYFMTITTIGWIDVFTRLNYRSIIIDSLKFCQQTKGLVIYAYVIMSNHLHLIASSDAGYILTDTIRDFKKFTAKEIIKTIKEIPESRREWMLNKFQYEANRTKRGKDYKFWQDGYHAKEIETVQFLRQKLDYIHDNPVEAGIVLSGEEYLFSSAKNYAGLPEILLDVEMAL
ncbi:MAG: transposase [Cyclobacteriaceae bacterium]|nr:transposase [Cyclobacteriaceae bacterium]MCK5281758.1 transposase [Cyclobacteriaceae bacterium]